MSRIMSMTGYGRAYYRGENFKLVITIKSVNGKGLEINFKTPRELTVYEKELRNLLKRYVHRGNVFVNVILELFKLRPGVQIEALTDVVDEILSASRRLGLSISDDMIIQLAFRFYNPTLSEEENFIDSADFKEVLSGTFEAALKDFLKSRYEEGQNLLKDVEENLQTLERLLAEVEKKKELLVEAQKRRLLQRAKELLGNAEENRLVAAELKLLLEKSDINEEIKRLKSHIEMFKEELQKGSPVGKKLEFIAQEMLREINTMGNKLPDLFPLNVEMKAAVDRIKQQVANIE